MTEQTLQNDTFERALLALVLADNAVLNRAGRLRPDDFADPVRGVIFETMRQLREDGRPANPVTLGGMFGSDPLGGGNILDDLRSVSFGDDDPKPEDLADALIDLSERRKLAEHGRWLAEHCQSRQMKLSDLVATVGVELDAIVNRLAGSKDACFDFSTAMEATIAELQSPSVDERILSRLKALDAMSTAAQFPASVAE
jgi:replicative DNA helicase